MLDRYREDPSILVWWGTEVEIVSALARLEREGSLTTDEASAALGRWHSLADVRSEMTPSERIRAASVRLLRVHDLRAADALQLAAALVASEGEPGSLEVVTLDERLAIAAKREGFPVVGA